MVYTESYTMPNAKAVPMEERVKALEGGVIEGTELTEGRLVLKLRFGEGVHARYVHNTFALAQKHDGVAKLGKDFPDSESYNVEVWGEVEDFTGYPKDEVDAWFKRCIDDFPLKKEQLELELASLWGQDTVTPEVSAEALRRIGLAHIEWVKKWFIEPGGNHNG